MRRTCACSGTCGPDGVSRRGFLTLLGTGALGLPERPASAQEMAAFRRSLRESRPRVYRSQTHTDVRFPLGGIGTGSFELGVDGRFTTWQLWNTLRDGHVPFFLALHAGGRAVLLQTSGGPLPAMPAVAGLTMTGEYPVARLTVDDRQLPVAASVAAFTPFAPLDTELSSLPAACFVVTLTNSSALPQTVGVGAFLQNVVGYDALGPVQSFNSVGFNAVPERWEARHPSVGGNVNAAVDGPGFTGVRCGAKPGVQASSARPIRLFTNVAPGGLNAFAFDHAPGFSVEVLDRLTGDLPNPDQTIVWIDSAPLDLPESTLSSAEEAVRRGATLVWSGAQTPLLTLHARSTVGPVAPDIVFEDFENGYGQWTITGEAFGTEPAAGTLPNQQAVSGFTGARLVNTYLRGDDTTGTLTSPPFVIERGYIRFLIGGGNHPTTQIRLLVDGRIVRRQSGTNDERLRAARWDVSELKGKTARIQIVDEQTGGWGHINIDEIVFSDAPVPAAVMARLDTLAKEGALGLGRIARHPGALLTGPEAETVGARQRAFAALAGHARLDYTPARGILPQAPGYGTLALGALAGRRTRTLAFTDWQPIWDAFSRTGALPTATAPMPTADGATVNTAVASTVTLAPGQSVALPFVLTWHFPNRYGDGLKPIGNHYTTRFADAGAALRTVAGRFETLRARTEAFHAAFTATTLPYWLHDAVSSQISTIRHPGVVFRTAAGEPYGWEGSNGCCPPTCTHVWGYEQTLAYLYPDLERGMRAIDLLCQQRPDGGINNRTAVPAIPGTPTGEQPFSDGHASGILKFYREVRNHTDSAYLPTHWPRIKAAVEYLIGRDGRSSVDGRPDGTLSDDQWNTYDNAIHGVNTFIGTYYLAALRAGEEMAKRVGDTATATRFQEIFALGQKNLVARCWNGEYFQQDLPDYQQRSGEYGTGCLSDQLIGQWWAHQLDLGYLLPPEQVRTAMRSVFRHNFLTDHTDFRHNWRPFAGGTDKGLLVCTWPRGGRPASTIPYVDEVWTGVEYQVAAHLIYEGMTDEGLSVARAVRDRYDGVPRAPIPRNPWNEIECGGHYARAMASWSVLLALSGWSYDAPNRSLRLTPRVEGDAVQLFFTASEGWGTVRYERDAGRLRRMTLTLTEGSLALVDLRLSTGGSAVRAVRRADQTLLATIVADGARFRGQGIRVRAGQALVVECA
jgi:uncharacterized protein (DUF608 family)